jgi:translation initiation factor IF-3
VRVINHDGTQLGVLPIREALELAERENLDIVEVSPNSTPPVCRIMDYGKFKYEQKKKASDARKSQHIMLLKEVKFRPNTSEHDYEVQGEQHPPLPRDVQGQGDDHLPRKGDRLPGHGRQMLQKIAEATKDRSTVESMPRFEGRAMIMILAPVSQS